jgi:glutaminyl-peptide cyclotransferase
MTVVRTAAALVALACLVGTVRQPVAAADTAPTWRHEVVRSFPHDTEAFTQGLLVRDGYLYESTGQKGRSSLRKVEIETGKVVQRLGVGNQYFAEGLAAWGPQLIQLTWETNIGFVYDRATFKQLRTFTYKGEGWGLADDGTRLVMSDGTPTLRFLNPDTLAEIGSVRVLDGPMAVDRLNELEVVKGEIFANVWLTDRIAVIAPATGRVVAWLNLTGLMQAPANTDAVLNGIAYDAARDRLFVTGKLWPRIFEIRVRRR